MKVDEFKQKLIEKKAHFDVYDDEIYVDWYPKQCTLTCATFFILDNDVLTFKLRTYDNPTVIKSIEFIDDEIVIDNYLHMRIVQYKDEVLLFEKYYGRN